MRKNKKKILSLFMNLTALMSISTIPTVVSVHKSIKTYDISKSDIETHAINGSEESLTFTVDEKPSWKGKIFAEQATNEQIKELLIPDKQYGANYSVKLLPITDEMKIQGFVHFVIAQVKNDFSGGVNGQGTKVDYIGPSSSPDQSKYMAFPSSVSTNKVTIDGEEVDNTKVWTTKSIKDLFIQQKYNFNWNSDSEIGEFLENTNKTVLTSEDIMQNFVSSADATDILPKDTKAEFSQTNINNNNEDNILEADAKKYGVGKITVDFGTNGGQTEDNWVGGKKPTDEQKTRIVRGLLGQDGGKPTYKYLVKLNFGSVVSSTNQNLTKIKLDVNKIREVNPVFPVEGSGGQIQLSSLTPSQIINALNGDLTSLLATPNFVISEQGQPAIPPIHIEYMGKNGFSDKDIPFKGTGLSAQTNVPYVDTNYNPIVKNGSPSTTGSTPINQVMKIVNISGKADDENGILDLTIKYNYYDIFKNVIVSDYTVPMQIKVASNSDTKNNLYFSWKSDGDIPFKSSEEFYSLYEKNQNNAAFLKDLSNMMFYGSNDTYKKDRKVEVTKGDGSNLTLKLTFAQYGDFTNKVFQKTFKFENSSSSSVNFKSQDDLNAQVGGLNTMTPEEFINKVANGEDGLSYDIFFDNSKTLHSEVSPRATSNVLLTSNASNDGIIVQVIGNNNYSWFTYTGMKKGQQQNYVYNFSFSASADDKDYQKLLEIPLQEITVKDVIDLYLKNLPLFVKGGTKFELSEQNVSLEKDEKLGSLTINVKIDQFQGTAEQSNNFKTTIYGLNLQNKIDGNSYVAPLNLTIPLTAAFAGLSTIALSVLLFLTIRKRVKLNKSKKMHQVTTTVTKEE